jgi:hypothetical protein
MTMSKKVILLIALSICLSLPVFAAEAQKSAGEEAGEHASKGAKPGSYEDWCGEHGVPESKDTRCNPALIPAFKATKDWCKDHGLPKSQDLKCNPQLKIVRPPKGAVKGEQ